MPLVARKPRARSKVLDFGELLWVKGVSSIKNVNAWLPNPRLALVTVQGIREWKCG